MRKQKNDHLAPSFFSHSVLFVQNIFEPQRAQRRFTEEKVKNDLVIPSFSSHSVLYVQNIFEP